MKSACCRRNDAVTVAKLNEGINGNKETGLVFDAEIARRAPPKKSSSNQRGLPVRGFHFVCRRDRGVVYNPDGTFWSGSWVVAKQQVERGVNRHIASHCAHIICTAQTRILYGSTNW